MLSSLLLSLNASASCGVDACPIEPPGAAPEQAQLRIAPRYTASPDGAAWYSELFVGGHLRLGEHLRLGGSVPLLLLRDAYGPQGAVGSALAFVDLQQRWSAVSLAAGVQLELPTSTREADGGHMVALPYLRMQAQSGSLDLRARGGWGATLGTDEHGDHDHGFTPAVQVNPHGSSELQLLAEPGWSASRASGSLRVGLSLAATRELSPTPQSLLSVSPSLELRRDRTGLRLTTEHPLTASRRFDHRLGLAFTLDLPSSTRSST